MVRWINWLNDIFYAKKLISLIENKMITVLDKTSNIFDAFKSKCYHNIDGNLPFYVIKTYNHDSEYGNGDRSHYKSITKMEFYNEIGFTECDETYPDISYYIPFNNVYDRACVNHNLLFTYRQLFYECNNFDIVIGKGEDVKYIKNQIRIRTRVITPGGSEIEDVYLNGKLIPLVNNDLTLTIKFALRKCIAQITVDDMSGVSGLNYETSELKSEITELKSQLNECKKLIMDQNNQLRSKIMQVFSLVDTTEIDALKKENEELKQYKKSMEQIIGLHTKQ